MRTYRAEVNLSISDVNQALPGVVTVHKGEVEAWLARVAAGDQRAFADLYSRFQGRVFGLCLALVRDRHQAEEVSQEAFLQIWQRASRFDPTRGTGTAWILQLAHGRAVDRVRHSQSVRLRDRNYFSAMHVAENDTVLESVLINEEHSAVRSALPLLSQKQRESLTLAYFGCMTTSQISELLALPLPTVKSRMRDGLNKLAEHLASSAPADMIA